MTLPALALLDPSRDTAFEQLLRALPGPNWVEVDQTWVNAGDLGRGRWARAAGLGSPAQEDGAQLNSFGATWELVRQLRIDRAAGRARIYFNPRGGDLPDLDDAAWAARELVTSANSVRYLDLGAAWPARTLELLDLEGIPGQSLVQNLKLGISGLGPGTGDLGLFSALSSALSSWGDDDLDVLILGVGADGLWSDPSTGLEYTVEGMGGAALQIGQFVARSGASVLVLGGRGGDDAPSAWLHVVASLAASLVFPALDTLPATG